VTLQLEIRGHISNFRHAIKNPSSWKIKSEFIVLLDKVSLTCFE